MIAAHVSAEVETGIKLTREGRFTEALDAFDKDILFTHYPLALSCYALCLAEVDANYERALSLSVAASEKEFYNPEIYQNLGRILLLTGQKTSAIKVFRKGLKFDTGHAGLRSEIHKLGLRRKPVVTFLPRQNFVNRFFGALSYKVAS